MFGAARHKGSGLRENNGCGVKHSNRRGQEMGNTSPNKGNSSANALTNDLLTDMGRGGAIQEARVDIEKVNA